MTDGIINVYKERGFTSHDVVVKLRGILKQKKIGHTGTLDPEAEGVLPVCLGKATRVCELLTDQEKTYRAVLLLGKVTDTQDMTGTVLEERAADCTEEQVRACIASFVGTQEQIPPMYSALKVNGKKLYELARKGIEVERKARTITIREIVIEQIAFPRVTMSVTCSKGTYIRTLCHDIGAALGCGGCMESLLRTQVGPFRLEESVRLSEIEAKRDAGALDQVIWRTDAVFASCPAIRLTEAGERLVRNGNPIEDRRELLSAMPDECGIEAVQKCAESDVRGTEAVQKSTESDVRGTEAVQKCAESDQCGTGMAQKDRARVRVYSQRGEFLAVYEWRKERERYWPVKMFL